ncbi:MAG TPA: flagellar basal body-associated protein FliL [Gammaproteobacteria bacterium]|jgi:flagellar FliL protein|nr:flagellar basal body-associated protein FliL [Gammaproteobacteria bacterium]
MRPSLIVYILITWVIVVLQVRAEDEDREAMYVKLTSGMVVNYGEPSLSRLHYLKVSVDVRVRNADHADAIEYHMPALQDALIRVFSAQEDELIQSAAGKEELRMMVLKELQKVIEKEEGMPLIQDLLFTGFIVQR